MLKYFVIVFLFCAFLLLTVGKVVTYVNEGQCYPIGDFRKIGDSNIHYLEKGSKDAPPIVFLHGASSNLRDWEVSLFPKLKDDYRLIALDRPGLGYSSRPTTEGSTLNYQVQTIHQFLQDIGVNNAIIVAHSLSGVIGARLLTDYPDNYSGLVLVAGAVFPIGDGRSWYTEWAVAPWLGHFFRYVLVPVAARYIAPDLIKKSFAPNEVPDDYVKSSCLNLLFTPVRFLHNAEDLNGIRPYIDDSYPRYRKITQPVLMFYGAQDKIVNTKAHTSGLLKQVPHAKNNILEFTGHLPHHFHGELIAEEIRKTFR